MTRYRRRFAVVAAAGALASASVGTAFSMTAGATDCRGAMTRQPKGWTRIAAPAFATGPSSLTTYAVRADRPEEVYASNGAAVARSGDGGCTWVAAYTVSATPGAASPLVAATARIVSLWAPAGTDLVYGLVTDGGRIALLRGSATRSDWSVTIVGAQPDATATNPELVAGRDLTTLYVLAGAASQARVSRAVYASTDGGATFAPATFAAGVAAAAAGRAAVITDLAADPLKDGTLYAATTAGLFRSPDAGATWNDAGIGAGGAIDSVTAGASRSGASATTAVLAFDNANTLVYSSIDDGGTWTAVSLPAAVDTSAVDSRQPASVVSTAKGVYQVQLQPTGVTAMWNDAPALSQVSLDAGPMPYVWACACGEASPPSLWRHVDLALPAFLDFVPPPPPIVVPGSSAGFDYQCQGNRVPLPSVGSRTNWAPSSVTPASKVIDLSPGQSVTMPFALHAAPRPLDVYYLPESGSKMEFALCSFEYGAVIATNEVQRERDLRVGLGEYRDYPGERDEWGTGGPVVGGGFTYVRRAATTTPGVGLTAGLKAMHWGLTPDRAGAVALYQAATGVGQDLAPSGPSLNDILAGMHADYDGHAYKVALTVTGAWFNAPERSIGYAGPPLAKAIQALRANDIHQVAIWVNNSGTKMSTENAPYEGRDDVRRFAVETGAVAHEPVDCNRDGYTDIPKGGPLVCDWLSIAANSSVSWTEWGDPVMGQEMATLLLALRDPEPVRLVPTRGAGAVQVVSPASYDGVNVLRANDHEFQVTFRCGAGQTNTTTPITLSGVAGPNVVAESDVVLRCGHPVPVIPQRPAAILPLPLPPVPPVPNPLPNPVPHPGAQPAPNPAPNPGQVPQAQAQPVANAAAMPQQEPEPQLAFQKASNELAANEPMSALRPPARDPLRPARRLALLAGVCAMAVAGVVQAAPGLGRQRGRGAR